MYLGETRFLQQDFRNVTMQALLIGVSHAVRTLRDSHLVVHLDSMIRAMPGQEYRSHREKEERKFSALNWAIGNQFHFTVVNWLVSEFFMRFYSSSTVSFY